MNETKKLKLDGLNSILVTMAVFMAILFLPTIIFAIAGNAVGVAISLTVIVMLFFGILIMGSFALGAAYARSSAKEGAGMVLSALQLDNAADTAMMNQATKLFIAGANTVKGLQPGDQPALPFPSQGDMTWMPQVSVLQPDRDEWE